MSNWFCPKCGQRTISERKTCKNCGFQHGEISNLDQTSDSRINDPVSRQEDMATPPPQADVPSLTDRAGRIWSHSRQKSSSILNQLIPPPNATRAANPYIAAGLELLGYAGFLGLGRTYAGDIAGGIRAFFMWWIALFGFGFAITIPGIIAIILAVPTLFISIFILILICVPPLFALLTVPLISATKLFVKLR